MMMNDEQVKRSNVGAVVLSRLMLPKELERWTDEELCKRMLTFELELMKELPIHTLLEYNPQVEAEFELRLLLASGLIHEHEVMLILGSNFFHLHCALMRTDENVLEIMGEKGVDSVAMGAALVLIGRTAIEASAGRINCPGTPSKKVRAAARKIVANSIAMQTSGCRAGAFSDEESLVWQMVNPESLLAVHTALGQEQIVTI